MRIYIRFSLGLAAGLMVSSLCAQTTLVSQGTSGFTAAQTTTIIATTGDQSGTDNDYRPTAYASGFMNDVNSSGTLSNDSNSTSTFLAGDGGGSVVYDGVGRVQLGSTTYTAGAGDTYARAGFFIDSGVFADSSSTAVTAANAGIAFRILGNQASEGTTSLYMVGINLVKVGDTPGVYTGTGSSLGSATVDFFVGLQVRPDSSSDLRGARGRVYVMGTNASANDSTATIGYASSANWVQLGATISDGDSHRISDTNYFQSNGEPERAFIKDAGSSADDANEISFGGLYSEINAALRAIYGTSTGIQWNQGDLVRFVPFSVVGSTLDFMGINSSQGGTGTLPFASNGTAAITDAYATGVNFELELQSIDGFNFGVVPEPATWISTGVMVTFGLGLLYWRRRRQLG
jgi:hypothetical protein